MKTAASTPFYFSSTGIFNFRRAQMSESCNVSDQARTVLRPTKLVAALGLVLVSSSAFAFSSGSTGADGALSPTVNSEIQVPPSGILNYTSVTIPAGVTVKFKKNALNTPVYLLLSGNATIAGTIDVSGAPGAQTGTSGDGNQADDGIPGQGGPGGFDGGRGGRDDPAQSPNVVRAGAGLGPGGGAGGTEGGTGCDAETAWYYKYVGGPAGYATDGNKQNAANCGTAYIELTKRPGKSYGSAILQPLIGGSGGGGGAGGIAYGGSGGGGGGGAILIAASGTISLTGVINADGGGGGYTRGDNVGGAGSGGSGGAIRLVATTLTGAGRAVAVGGCLNDLTRAGYKYYPNYQANYASAQLSDCNPTSASDGRVRIEADNITFSGQTFPSYTTDVPGPVFLSSLPSLRIATVAGQAVPANPTGKADLTFPANLTNPVTIDLATVNVPSGNTVLVKVIPAYGSTQEVISPAITGSTASGVASVQVTLPQGPSVLQATTTYTVVVAMGDALSRFAENERVEKVQLMATLGGESQAKLITISGKEFVVPVSILQMVGFVG